MDQIKTGAFLKELRKEKGLSQEQLADKFNTSSRSISRWENGRTMPDISMLIELADFFDVDIREILRGERKSEKMNADIKETLEMVADYTEEDKAKILNKVYFCGLGATVFSVISLLLLFLHPFINAGEDLQLIVAAALAVFSLCTLIAGVQLRGKTSKKKIKTILKITIPILIVVILAFIIFMTFFMPNLIVYGSLTPPGF